MPDLQFDDAQNFDQNIEKFLRYMEAKDDKMGPILRTHINSLKGAQDDRSRYAARTNFNRAVADSLDKLREEK